MPTPFFPLFAILFFVAMKSPRHWFIASVIGATFQAASPILVAGGGRYVGMSPAYMLFAAGLLHFLKIVYAVNPGQSTSRWRQPIPLAFWFLFLFSLYAVVGAVLFPRVFAGATRVLPPRAGIDSGYTYPLIATSTNIIQSIYVALNLALVACTMFFFKKRLVDASDVVKALKYSFVIISLLGVYQLIAYRFHLFWPSALINSNLGISQSFEQTVLDTKRMSSTFQEPSILAMHLLGLTAAFFVSGVGTLWVAAGMLMILMTTSSVGYAGLIILGGISLIASLSRRDVKILAMLMLSVVCMAALWLVDESLFAGQLTKRLLFSKLQSGSGMARMHADVVGFTNFVETYGIGVGLGSARASSALSTLMANTGLIGITSMIACMFTGISGVIRNQDPNVCAVGAGLGGMAIGACLGVPDLATSMTWLLFGAAIGLSDSIRTEHIQAGKP